ncbi:MAG: hypothetical protein ACPG5U_07945, partial [Planktomarina sp.]
MAAGIRMVSEEEVERVPGQPKLAVYFSNTNPDSGCYWSVFATLTQTAILTRDINVKVSAGTWAFMSGYDPDQPGLTEFDAITEVFTKFSTDFRAANARDFQPTNVAPYRTKDGHPMTMPQVAVKSYDQIYAEEGPVQSGDNAAPAKAAVQAVAETAPLTQQPQAPKTVEAGFTPAAIRPELTPKALRRLNLEVLLDGEADAQEKVTVTGGE